MKLKKTEKLIISSCSMVKKFTMIWPHNCIKSAFSIDNIKEKKMKIESHKNAFTQKNDNHIYMNLPLHLFLLLNILTAIRNIFFLNLMYIKYILWKGKKIFYTQITTIFLLFNWNELQHCCNIFFVPCCLNTGLWINVGKKNYYWIYK